MNIAKFKKNQWNSSRSMKLNSWNRATPGHRQIENHHWIHQLKGSALYCRINRDLPNIPLNWNYIFNYQTTINHQHRRRRCLVTIQHSYQGTEGGDSLFRSFQVAVVPPRRRMGSSWEIPKNGSWPAAEHFLTCLKREHLCNFLGCKKHFFFPKNMFFPWNRVFFPNCDFC